MCRIRFRQVGVEELCDIRFHVIALGFVYMDNFKRVCARYRLISRFTGNHGRSECCWDWFAKALIQVNRKGEMFKLQRIILHVCGD